MMKYNMIILKSFMVQKTNKKSEKAPDRRMTAKYGEEWVEIASGWVKKDKNGNDYVSCQMSKSWVDHTDRTKTRKGFVIVAEEDLKVLFKSAGEEYPEDAPRTPENEV